MSVTPRSPSTATCTDHVEAKAPSPPSAASCMQAENSINGTTSANATDTSDPNSNVALPNSRRPSVRSRISGMLSPKSNTSRKSSRTGIDDGLAPNEPASAPVTRFQMEEHGHHEHNIDFGKRKEKRFGITLSKIDQISQEHDITSKISNWISSIRKDKDKTAQDPEQSGSPPRLAQKYGRNGVVVGSGAFGTVRVTRKSGAQDQQLFAIKELKQRAGESAEKYDTRVAGEFGISSSMHHPNIVATLDALHTAKGVRCLVMEYCPGGDLHRVIIESGQLEVLEADCFFKQLMWGVEYLHEMGIAHRDLKPENILLTQSGSIKITDFGNAECFRTAWEMGVHMTTGVCGSAPYIAPEEYVDKEFDPRAVDVWACGVIYIAMRTGRHLWQVARKDRDESFRIYLEDRRKEEGYEPIEGLKRRSCQNVVYSTLDPSPARRLTANQVLLSEWVKKIKVCSAGCDGR